MQRRLIVATILLLASPLTLAAQATGELVEMTDTRIVIKKGKRDLEIIRNAGTRVADGVKAGDRVTAEYTMTATSIKPKPAKKSDARPKDKVR